VNKLATLFAVAAASGITCLSATAQEPAPIKVEDTQTLTATVASIDKDKRLIELRKGDARTTVQVPSAVRNLDQVKVGDELTVKYQEGFAAQFKKPGESKTTGIVDVATNNIRSGDGARPGGAVANTVTTTVVIEAVDRPTNSVTFKGPSGMTRTVDVKDARAKEFISTLKKGDEVELTYTEALAVTLEPKRK
jgi:hypothetical protein